MIYRFCAWRTGTSHDAEDAATEVFIKILVGKADAVAPDRLTGWLLKVAENECKMILRKRRRRREVDLEEGLEVAHSGREPWVSVDLHRALDRLKARQKQILFLKAVEDLTFPEIAKALGTTEGAVKMMFYRAIKTLENFLSDGGGSHE